MNLVEYLLKSRTKEELAKELAAHARENAALRDRAGELEHRLFWTEVALREAQAAAKPHAESQDLH
jgi:hypothetical protein